MIPLDVVISPHVNWWPVVNVPLVITTHHVVTTRVCTAPLVMVALVATRTVSWLNVQLMDVLNFPTLLNVQPRLGRASYNIEPHPILKSHILVLVMQMDVTLDVPLDQV